VECGVALVRAVAMCLRPSFLAAYSAWPPVQEIEAIVFRFPDAQFERSRRWCWSMPPELRSLTRLLPLDARDSLGNYSATLALQRRLWRRVIEGL